jgi:hypothetical protein
MLKYSQDIFKYLSNGKFISSNTTDPLSRSMYNELDEYRNNYKTLFSQIGFQLQEGDGYFYFTREESEATTERKLLQFREWIGYLEFLKIYDSGFDVGTKFKLMEIENCIAENLELNDKLQRLFPKQGSNRDKIESIIIQLVQKGFAELVDEAEEMYQVTSAYHYLENIINLITEDIENEKSE